MPTWYLIYITVETSIEIINKPATSFSIFTWPTSIKLLATDNEKHNHLVLYYNCMYKSTPLQKRYTSHQVSAFIIMQAIKTHLTSHLYFQFPQIWTGPLPACNKNRYEEQVFFFLLRYIFLILLQKVYLPGALPVIIGTFYNRTQHPQSLQDLTTSGQNKALTDPRCTRS